jgi:hypothetical protein
METRFLKRGKARFKKFCYLSAAIPRMRDTTPPLVVQGLHVAHRLENSKENSEKQEKSTFCYRQCYGSGGQK